MDQESQRKLFDAYFPNVKMAAKKIASTLTEYDDLVQEGAIALIHAINRYDSTRGNLWPFARIWVHGAMLEFKYNGFIPIDFYDTIEDYCEADSTPVDDAVAESDETRRRVESIRKYLLHLEPMHRRVIELRFLSQRQMTLQEIGDLLGRCRQRIFQIETEALEELRRMVGDAGPRESESLGIVHGDKQ